MKSTTKKLIGVVFVASLLSGFLTACSQEQIYNFVEQDIKHWRHYGEGAVDYPYLDYDYDDDYDDDDWDYGDDDDDDDYGSGGSHTADEEPFKYDKYNVALGDTEVAIYANRDYCKDENLLIPKTYVSGGITYTVVMDVNSGFASLPCKTMTLQDGFKKLSHVESCTNLTKITIPSSLQKIGEYAFNMCTKLATIEFKGTKAQWNAIEKGVCWNRLTSSDLVVSCSDGVLNDQAYN